MARDQLPNAISILLVEILGSTHHPLAPQMAEWLVASKRFRLFADTYRDKIRKKVRTAGDREALRDVQGELAVAYYLLQEPRFAVHYELQNASKQRAPDFTVLFRDNLPFHVEVTRLRATLRDTPAAPAGQDAQLAKTLCGKLGQMQPGAINVLAILTEAHLYAEADIVAATRGFLLRASNKDEAYFAWFGFENAREFLRQYQRLSAVLMIDGWQRGGSPHTLLWENNQARHPAPAAILTALRRMASPSGAG